MGRKNAVPDRWEAYSIFGRPVQKTRFIAFKVPLNDNINRNLEEEKRCNPADLISRLKDEGLRLGLIIDLTNTHRYYAREDVTKFDVGHKKILTEGHQVPSRRVCADFKDTVQEFMKQNTENDLLIGVHCTHGVNRTGYLICRYMIETMNIDPKESIELFNKARGHSIEREAYLDHLRNREWENEVSTPETEKCKDPAVDQSFVNGPINNYRSYHSMASGMGNHASYYERHPSTHGNNYDFTIDRYGDQGMFRDYSGDVWQYPVEYSHQRPYSGGVRQYPVEYRHQRPERCYREVRYNPYQYQPWNDSFHDRRYRRHLTSHEDHRRLNNYGDRWPRQRSDRQDSRFNRRNRSDVDRPRHGYR